MKIIVVDLELTNPKDPNGYSIIQIGAVLCNTNSFKIEKEFNVICKPDVHRPDEFITGLTGITLDAVENGEPLGNALIDFWKWCEECQCGLRIYDWGASDIRILKSQSEEYGVQINGRIKTLDIKQLFSAVRQLKDNKAKSRGGLANTMKLFGLDFIGTPHDALDDAKSTAYLYLNFLKTVRWAYQAEKAGLTPDQFLGK